MNIMLGNLTVKQIEDRLGIALTEEEITILKESHQDAANNIAPDKWHCFDMPFAIRCGSKEFAEKLVSVFKPYSSKMKTQFRIVY